MTCAACRRDTHGRCRATRDGALCTCPCNPRPLAVREPAAAAGKTPAAIGAAKRPFILNIRQT